MLGDLGSYLPEHVRPYADLLRQFPANYEKWVHATSLPAEIYQGDVVESILLTATDEDGEIIMADLPGMVLSCSCDAQPKQGEFALVAPVYDFEFYKKNSELTGEALENHLRDVTANKIANLFFLPAGQKLAASVIDFQKASPVSVEFLHKTSLGNRLTSLSQTGHYLLLVKLAHHLTRPDSVDAKRQ